MKTKAIDLKRVRMDIASCEKIIHFNNAGAALPTNQVLNRIIQYLHAEAALGGYEAEEDFAEEIQRVHHSIAQLINSKASEVAIVESATKAWDLALSSIAFSAGDRILTSSLEYISNYLGLLQLAEKLHLKIDIIPNDSHGQTCLSSLSKMVDEKVKLIAITHVPSTNGMVNPLEGISAIAKSVNALFLLDACQSIGQMPIDVEAIGCDFLAATGRKFLRAPRGTGFLYVRESSLKQHDFRPQFSDFTSASVNFNGSFSLAQNASRFENYETSYANRLGLGVAVNYALELGLENIWERICLLSEELRSSLAKIPEVKLCDTGIIKSGIVTFSVEGFTPLEIKKYLRSKQINVSTASKAFAFDLHERKVNSVVRASIHYYNTSEEILNFTNEVKSILAEKK
jgi:cysteine desulfurase/selenocysteine lyase